MISVPGSSSNTIGKETWLFSGCCYHVCSPPSVYWWVLSLPYTKVFHYILSPFWYLKNHICSPSDSSFQIINIQNIISVSQNFTCLCRSTLNYQKMNQPIYYKHRCRQVTVSGFPKMISRYVSFWYLNQCIITACKHLKGTNNK